ncbi:MAG: phage holin family protein [Candidatus Wolfebacteria bacterium]|nr:phage holin family protein [Candidatus Wolfebacteria bacterium]MDP2704655.1 phage holin family protein [bacterium]
MRLFSNLILHLAANTLAILAADYFIKDFSFTGNFKELFVTAAIFTSINIFIRPIIKFILAPFIILTLGLLSVVINAAFLYILDILRDSLTIEGYIPLLLATLLISLINIVVSLSAKAFSSKKE